MKRKSKKKKKQHWVNSIRKVKKKSEKGTEPLSGIDDRKDFFFFYVSNCSVIEGVVSVSVRKPAVPWVFVIVVRLILDGTRPRTSIHAHPHPERFQSSSLPNAIFSWGIRRKLSIGLGFLLLLHLEQERAVDTR